MKTEEREKRGKPSANAIKAYKEWRQRRKNKRLHAERIVLLKELDYLSKLEARLMLCDAVQFAFAPGLTFVPSLGFIQLKSPKTICIRIPKLL